MDWFKKVLHSKIPCTCAIMQREEIYTWNAKCLYAKAMCNMGVSNLLSRDPTAMQHWVHPLIFLEKGYYTFIKF